MKLAIMQPYLFPYLGYWQLLEAADVFVFYDDVQFVRRSFMTRNRILLEEQSFQFALPTIKANRESQINEILMDKSKFNHWREKLLKTVHHAYAQSPHFQEVFPFLEKLLDQSESHLSEFLKTTIKTIADYLEINVKFASSSEVKYARDGTAEEKIISLCKEYNAKTYINRIGGRDLYQSASFHRNSIQLLFLQSTVRPYSQFNLPFKSHLSIIDTLMFLSKGDISERLKDYQLIPDETLK